MLFTKIIKDNKSFLRCYRRGGYCACPYLCVYYLKNDSPYNRLGISVGKKQGKAVVRNRIKRVFRAAYRLSETDFPIGYDIVFMARGEGAAADTREVMGFIKKRVIPRMNEDAAGGRRKKK